MNSYWIEHQARQRIDELIGDARGDQLKRAAEPRFTARPSRAVPTGLGPRMLAFRLLEALARRSKWPATRAR